VTLTGLVDVPTVAKSMAELQGMDPDLAAYVTEFAANSVAYQINEMGKTKQNEQERVRFKRARYTRALSPLHHRQLKCPPPWLDSRQPLAAAVDSAHACSHSAPRTSSRPSRDTHALSLLRPQFEASNKVVPMYSQVHADIDSGASMPMTPHASLISEGQQCNMSMKLADSLILTSNTKRGFLNATCKLLPKIEALHMPDLAATLISSPQLVSEGKMDNVHSKHYGSFMQPACDSCPICTPYVDRIIIATTATDMSISITPYDKHVFLGNKLYSHRHVRAHD